MHQYFHRSWISYPSRHLKSLRRGGDIGSAIFDGACSHFRCSEMKRRCKSNAHPRRRRLQMQSVKERSGLELWLWIGCSSRCMRWSLDLCISYGKTTLSPATRNRLMCHDVMVSSFRSASFGSHCQFTITISETVSLFLRLCYVMRLLRCSYVICVLYVPRV